MYERRIELRLALIRVQAVLLLLHVVELGIAEAAHLAVAKQRLGQRRIALEELGLGGGTVAIAPALAVLALPYAVAGRPYAAVFAMKYG